MSKASLRSSALENEAKYLEVLRQHQLIAQHEYETNLTYNPYAYQWTTVTPGGSGGGLMDPFAGMAPAKPAKPEPETPEQWLRRRVRETCWKPV